MEHQRGEPGMENGFALREGGFAPVKTRRGKDFAESMRWPSDNECLDTVMRRQGRGHGEKEDERMKSSLVIA